MDMDRERLLNEIMKNDFAMVDLRLFLNTHPNEKEAIRHFNNMAMESAQLTKEFESKYGPLSQKVMSDEEYFNWINEPWPWERAFMERSRKGER